MTKPGKIVKNICTILFILGIIVGMAGRLICIRPNDDYKTKQPELFAPDVIDCVLYDEDSRQIYVCYNDASYVNVYTEKGEFRWAVSTPYLNHAYFELSSGQLVVYGVDTAYFYDAENGDFIREDDVQNLDLKYEKVISGSADTFEKGELYYGTYQVYEADGDGGRKVIVPRPSWYWLFNFVVDWCVSFIGAAGLGIVWLAGSFRDYKATVGNGKEKTILRNKDAAFIVKYDKIKTAIHLVYAAADIACGIFFGGILCIGIAPIAVHYIVSNIIIFIVSGKKGDTTVSSAEKTAIDHWTLLDTASFIVAFLSVIVAAALAK